MAKKPDVRVTGNRTEKYQAKSDGASRAASRHETQAEAIEAAKRIAERRGVDVVVHGTNGKIRSKDSYGNDPNPPRDREH